MSDQVPDGFMFNLHTAMTDRFSSADFIGNIRVPAGPVGMSSDGTWLYVASVSGTLGVLSLNKAESHQTQAHAVVSEVPAGCGAIRAMSPGTTRSSG